MEKNRKAMNANSIVHTQDIWEKIKQIIYFVFEDFYCQLNRNKFQPGFDDIYPENNQRVPRQK